MESGVRRWVQEVHAKAELIRSHPESDPAQLTPMALERTRGFIGGVMETLRALDLVTPDEWREWAVKSLRVTFPQPSESDFDDPSYSPPEDLEERLVPLYEQRIIDELRSGLSAWPSVDAIELRGQRPETEVVIRYTARDGGSREWTRAFWRDGYADDEAPLTGTLNSPQDMAAGIAGDWRASW